MYKVGIICGRRQIKPLRKDVRMFAGRSNDTCRMDRETWERSGRIFSERGRMSIKNRRWTHDWRRYNFDGVRLVEDGDVNGLSSLSQEEVKEYLVWLACNEPAKYGRLMLYLRRALYRKSS